MKINSIFFLYLLSSLSVTKAQTSFLNQLTEQTEGQGTITVVQDAQMDSIVNGLIIVPSAPEIEKKNPEHIKSTQTKVQNGALLGAKQMSGAVHKAKGYRIQVYFGGSKAEDKKKAQQLASKIHSRYPELLSYVTFVSPHWRCRVGNFAKKDEAEIYRKKLHVSGLAPNSMIVQSEIYIPEEDEED